MKRNPKSASSFIVTWMCAGVCVAATACGASGGDGENREPTAPAADLSASDGAQVDAASVGVYVTRTKELLTGSPATSDEINAVVADPNALSGLVATWLASVDEGATSATSASSATQTLPSFESSASAIAPHVESAAATPLVPDAGKSITEHDLETFASAFANLERPTNNFGNAWVFGTGGYVIETLGMMYERTKTAPPQLAVNASTRQSLLVLMSSWADSALSQRNDYTERRLLWTGKKNDPVWPNQPADDPNGYGPYAGSETGDVVGHIAYTAKLILQTPSIWGTYAPNLPGMPGTRETYLRRAVRYVKEARRTTEAFFRPYFIDQATKHQRLPLCPTAASVGCDFYTLGHFKSAQVGVAVPWNQQTMINNAFQRLAECFDEMASNKTLTPIGSPAIAILEAQSAAYAGIVAASVDDFFVKAALETSASGESYFSWHYDADSVGSEDTGHSGYTLLGLYRAYQSPLRQPIFASALAAISPALAPKLGVPPSKVQASDMMKVIANDQMDVVYDPKATTLCPNGTDICRWAGRVDGTSDPFPIPPAKAAAFAAYKQQEPTPAALLYLDFRADRCAGFRSAELSYLNSQYAQNHRFNYLYAFVLWTKQACG